MLLYTLAAVGARGPPELATMGAAAYKAVFRILFRVSASLLDPDPCSTLLRLSWIRILFRICAALLDPDPGCTGSDIDKNTSRAGFDPL
jgi:hypothetical protein